MNLLRSTIACFAAGIAGADAITVLPHDFVRGDAATELGRRIGRNTQSILLEESHLDEVIDPAGGSWFVESFTDQLADAAWAVVQEIEAAGGFRSAAASGLLAERIAATPRRPPARHRHPHGPADRGERVPQHQRAGPVSCHRWTRRTAGPAPLERGLRGPAPPCRRRRPRPATARAVFLATIGPAAVFTPRITFARNFFEVAGLATTTGPVTDDPDEIADAFRTSGATVACLCSSDPVYGEQAVPVAQALLDAGAAAVYVAGRPKAALADLAAIGVERTIHVGADVRATLAELLDLLEVP